MSRDHLAEIEHQELAATTELITLEHELRQALDRIDGDASGLNEETARFLADQANMFRRALKHGNAARASRETVNG